MTTEIIEGETRVLSPDEYKAERAAGTGVGAGRELAIMETVALPVSVDVALQQWADYQRLTRELLDDSDYQSIGKKRFKKKSAWRKYARAFNITDRVTYEHVERDATGHPIWARLRVEARATNGRTAEADHECHVRERCCSQPCSKRSWKDHYCCTADCDARKHWSHPGDLPATALTRAKNRAISDLIGAGEVSAEEMTEQSTDTSGNGASARSQPRQSASATAFERDESRRPDAGAARIPPSKPAPEQSKPDMRAPLCPQHEQECNWIKAGTSAAGKKYGSFYACPDRSCTAGRTGKGFSISTADWQDILSREANEAAPEKIDLDDLPFE